MNDTRQRLTRILRRLLLLASALSALLTVHGTLIRPWYLNWGATTLDRERALPGDELIPNGTRQTRAITIRADAPTVFAWVAQLGQDRGGFYSYSILEDLVGAQMPREYTLRPELQQWGPNDSLWMYPRHRAGGYGRAPLLAHEPGRALVFGTRRPGTSFDQPIDGTWAFVVESVAASESRLLIRAIGRPADSIGMRLFETWIFAPMHFVMERRTMTEIRDLSEGRTVSDIENHVEVVLFALTFLLFVAAFVETVRRQSAGRAITTFVGAGILFQVLTLLQPSSVLGLALLAPLVALFVWPEPRPRVLRDRTREMGAGVPTP